MRVLFIPGGLGYGHVSKCLALADELKLLGTADIAFGFGGPDRHIIENKGYPVLSFRFSPNSRRTVGNLKRPMPDW
jgi:UDP:flavonoid glycosyltransferase YjiC (YdhE family)